VKKNDRDFSVEVEALEIPQIEARLKKELCEAEASIARLTDHECPNSCYENAATGRWVHENDECLAYKYNMACPFSDEQECVRKLDRLNYFPCRCVASRIPRLRMAKGHCKAWRNRVVYI
jgi:hypothetical protein